MPILEIFGRTIAPLQPERERLLELDSAINPGWPNVVGLLQLEGDERTLGRNRGCSVSGIELATRESLEQESGREKEWKEE